MNYLKGAAKVGRLVTFEANASRYNVMVVEGAEGWTLIVDGEGRWVARVATIHAANRPDVQAAVFLAGNSVMDAEAIAKAVTGDFI